MYDPSVGRWMQEDPIGFGGGTPNVYEYVGNQPTDATDPTGLFEQGLGVAWAPKSFEQWPTLPSVEYTQIRGTPFDIGSGIWGQPGSTASGWGKFFKNYSIGSPGATIQSAFGGAESYVKITGTGSPGGHCNTVLPGFSNPPEINAGKLIARVSNFKKGTYEAFIDIRVHLQAGPGNISSQATVWVANESGKLEQISPEEPIKAWDMPLDSFPLKPPGTKTNPTAYFEKRVTIKFRSNSNRDRIRIAVVDPVAIAGKTGWASMDAQISVLSIKGPLGE